MKRFLALAAVAVLQIAPSMAADFRPQIDSKTPGSGWSGFYAGLNFGYGVSRAPSTTHLRSITWDYSLEGDLSLGGYVGGAQAGYNWQFAPRWLVGLEADVQRSGQRVSSSYSDYDFNPFSTELRLDYFGTIRGRLGWTPTSATLTYLTGGFAWGGLEQGLSLPRSALAGSSRTNKVGWTAGGGIETQLGGGWTARVEYLYLDLGGVASAVGAAVPRLEFDAASVRSQIARVGLNYGIGRRDDADRFSLAADPDFRWTGIYGGVNGGYAASRSPSLNGWSEPPAPAEVFNSIDLAAAGFVAGGQIGYNRQFASNLVIGFEADIQFSKLRGGLGFSIADQPNHDVTSPLVATSRLNYYGTARGRVGWTPTPSTLAYVTGGLAWGQTQLDMWNDVVDNPACGCQSHAAPVLSTGSFKKNNVGWTVGGGAETVITGNWTAKIEYLYLDLGRQNQWIIFNDGSPFHMATVDLHAHIARMGLNYHF
jgi:outer membrane immunogenic protein